MQTNNALERFTVSIEKAIENEVEKLIKEHATLIEAELRKMIPSIACAANRAFNYTVMQDKVIIEIRLKD